MSEAKTSPLDLERAALAELDVSSLSEAQRAQVEALQVENAQFLADHPAGPAVAEIRRRFAGAPRGAPVRAAWIAAPALAAAFALLLFLRPPSTEPSPEQERELTRSKGTAQLLIHRATALGIEKLKSGATARAGDRLQLGYGSGTSGYGVIASIDGNGVVNIHFPKDGAAQAGALNPQGEALPFSYELDDAPRLERFFLVTADAPFPVALVREAAQRLADAAHDPLALPSSYVQAALLLRKVDR